MSISTTPKQTFVEKVVFHSDAHAVCIQHALSSETAEIMGLLVGLVDEENNISYIHHSLILHRSDIKPDRVEISPEQLCSAGMDVEEIACAEKKPLKVLGWYHSHPHITVWPSHVDLRTQATYQEYMDPRFIGIIFSVYNGEKENLNRIQVTCFQTKKRNNEFHRHEIPIEIISKPNNKYNLENFTKLPKILFQEEAQNYNDEMRKKVDKLAALHNEAHQTQILSHITISVSVPLFECVQEKILANKEAIKNLKIFKQQLLQELKKKQAN